MIEEFLLQYSGIISSPVIYGAVLFALIITQVFGVVFNVLLLVTARFMPGWIFFAVTFGVGLFAECACYLLGSKFNIFLKKRFPKFVAIMKQYASLVAFVLARFAGMPFLSYLMGATGSIKFGFFSFGTALFFAVNTGLILALGKTLPSRYFNAVIVLLVVVIGSQALLQAWKSRRKHE